MAYSGTFVGVEALEQRCLMSATPVLPGASAPNTTGNTYYISPSGSALNNGTQNSPWSSIGYAYSRVGPGNTFVLEPGSYGFMTIPASFSGTAANPTIIRSQYLWQAVVDGQGTDMGLQIQSGAQYVVVDGLQIRNCLNSGITMSGSHDVISNNWVSHCGRSGILISSGSYNLVQGNLTEYNGTDYWDGGGISVSGDHETVTGNVVRHNDFIGIVALTATNDVISGNLIYGQDDRSGLQVIAAGSSAHNSVTNNTLLHDKVAIEGGLAGVQTYSGNVIVPDASIAALDRISSGQVSQYSQVNPAWFTPDTVVPTINLVSSTVNFMDQYMLVTVQYKDNVGIDTSSLGNGDLTLSGPNGYQQTAVLMGWTQNANGVSAVYGFRSPGAIWDAQDNGAYTLSVQSGQIADDSGPSNYVASGSLSQVTVGLTNRSIYVSPTGLTTNNGTQNSPFPSVAYALSVVGGGQTIILEPGTYAPFYVPRGDGGTVAHPTVIQSQYKWQAVIDGTNYPTIEGVASETNGAGGTTNYVTFDGLKVVNAGTNGIALGGDWDVAKNCWVTGSKGSGIFAGAIDYTMLNTIIQNNLIENNGTSWGTHGIYADGYGLIVSGNVIRHSSGYGIQLYPSVQNSTVTGNLVYGEQFEADAVIEGPTGSNTFTNNILLASGNSSSGVEDWGPNAFAVWSGNRIETTISGNSLDSIKSNNVADYTAALAAIMPSSAVPGKSTPVGNVFDTGWNASTQAVWVRYSDTQALSLQRLSPSNVIVKGPGGYSASPQSILYIHVVDTRTVEVVYALTPPKGGWTSANTGAYTVSLQASQISNVTGNYAPAGVMPRGFSLAIAPTVKPAAAPAGSTAGSGGATTGGGAGSSGGVTPHAAAPLVPAVVPASLKPVCGPMPSPFADFAGAKVETLDLLPALPPLRLTMSPLR